MRFNRSFCATSEQHQNDAVCSSSSDSITSSLNSKEDETSAVPSVCVSSVNVPEPSVLKSPKPTEAETKLYGSSKIRTIFGTPRDIVKSACKIPSLTIPKLIFHGKNFSIRLTCVHSPYKFWFQLHGDVGYADMDFMLAQMWRYYNSDTPNYRINRNSCIRASHACAVYANEIWNRGEILTELNCNQVCRVWLLDTGEIVDAHANDLRYLKKCFAKHPRLALRGRMALVAPPNDELLWPLTGQRDATSVLRQLQETLLQANLYAYEQSENIFHLTLFDARQLCISINEALGTCGAASSLKNQPSCEVFPHPDEIFPTFAMLEGGQYPTYETLVADQNYAAVHKMQYVAHSKGGVTKKTRVVLRPQEPEWEEWNFNDRRSAETRPEKPCTALNPFIPAETSTHSENSAKIDEMTKPHPSIDNYGYENFSSDNFHFSKSEVESVSLPPNIHTDHGPVRVRRDSVQSCISICTVASRKHPLIQVFQEMVANKVKVAF